MRPTTSSCILYSASLLFTSIAGATSTSTGINSTDIPQQYGRQDPSVVRKMSDDEGEKFYFDYWSWDDSFLSSSSSAKRGVVNTSAIELVEPQPAMLLHTSTDADLLLSAEEEKRDYARSARRALFALLGRDFQCPAGTFSCSAIGQPASCCGNGATCIIVQDTGLGVVGCCPAGETCGGTVSSCGSGYTSCPSSRGGGCCIPGYTCVTGGCAFVSTYTVTRQSTTFISSSTVSTAPTVPTVSTTSSSTHTTTTTSTTSSSTSSSSIETSTTVSPVPPVRPTTSSQTTITSTTSSSSSSLSSGISTCPTGFYACSAVYEGGCCRTGRNCDTTSCPATSSTTLINTDGVTIAVPTGSAATAASESSGSCATGWFSCAASAGGGCCPSGYVCGSSCTASSSGTATATVVKEQPAAGGRYVANVYFCGVMALLIAICFHFGF